MQSGVQTLYASGQAEHKEIRDMEVANTMPRDYWMSLPVEVRKALVEKRKQASNRMQGSITCEKYGVYMKS